MKTLANLKQMKRAGQKIACLTAYDASFAYLADQAGVDLILVGDSVGVVAQGHRTTVPVTVEDIAYHCRCVGRGARAAVIMADMPFMSCCSIGHAMKHATYLLQTTAATIVKCELMREQESIVPALSDNGVASCAHHGLQPQRINKFGTYAAHAKQAHGAADVMKEAESLVEAGVDMLLLECVSAELAARISERLPVVTIGIGSGGGCDGQILVMHDVLGLTQKPPAFSRDFLAGAGSVAAAFGAYVRAVKDGSFPGH